ncbi:Pyrroline-5-carboxylate reductase [compost metagenome]|uniref:pyrroline-5-carboxylate reductase n=1 Tax=Aeromonas TaxID=642 RepID=UPI000F96C862|nr:MULTISPECIES: pyrroline-5-carboxylate reductase [Aeromonas]MBP6072003.1 pyrroline-5-carboxylate reductase [Aeromonas sp.]MDM5077889.1 pyrroline-5-carboxylate reductase [Aeromonas media]WED81870.1 pyrroline-5-carboxylate reductase [Aeromonas media]
MQHKRTLAFIGAGNMSRSIIAGLIQAGYPAGRIIAANPSRPKLDELADQFGIRITQNNAEAAREADVIVLAVKPQLMAAMLEALVAELGSLAGKLLISIAAGIKVERLQEMAGGHARIIRTMPNTPSLLGLGMTGLYAPTGIDQADRDFAEQMMQAVGKTLWVAQESGINGVIAAAGSAPAYFFLFMQGIAEEAEAMGFSPEQARLLVQQTALGAAAMVEQNPELSLQALREQVTSKGGTTAEAVKTFQEQGLKPLTSRAMQAAVTRAAEMETLF